MHTFLVHRNKVCINLEVRFTGWYILDPPFLFPYYTCTERKILTIGAEPSLFRLVNFTNVIAKTNEKYIIFKTFFPSSNVALL